MAKDLDGHLETVTAQLRLGISPAEIVGGLRNTVNALLWDKSCKFDKVMNGVPMLYEKIEVDAGSVTTNHPSGVYCVNATATALVFRPKIGGRLSGTVQHLSLDGIVMSVLGQFTGIIKKVDMPMELIYSTEEFCFCSTYNSNCRIRIQDTLPFTVKDVMCYGDDFCICGSLI